MRRRLQELAALMFFLYVLLVLASAAAEVRHVVSLAVAWALCRVVAALAIGAGLRREERWAPWAALPFAALFGVLGVAAALVAQRPGMRAYLSHAGFTLRVQWMVNVVLLTAAVAVLATTLARRTTGPEQPAV